MKKEEQLILTTVLLNKTEEEKRIINQLLLDKLDWAYIGGILINHRLSGYFYRGLGDDLKAKIPKEVGETLRLIVVAQKEQQLRNCRQVELISKESIDKNIRFAALKGAFFNAEMYELGLRRSNDIDFLVYEEDLEKLDDILRKLGYIQSNLPEGELIEASKREKLIQRMNHHDLVPYVKRVNDEVVEVDINFLFDGKENMIDKQVFDIGTKRYGKTYSVNALVPETNLAFLCVHFFREATNTIWTDTKRDLLLYKIVDIMNFIRVYSSEIDAEKWLQIIASLNLEKKCYYTFYVVSQFYHDNFVESVKDRLKPADEDFLNMIYDSKEKEIRQRTSSIYDAAFDCIR